MSKIALTPNASGTGTLTVAAPNTNTDRTLTLPDITGTLVSSDASGNVGIGTSSPSTFGKLVALSADDNNTIVAVASNGLIRMKGYLASAASAVIEATNTAQSLYASLFINGSTLLFGTGGAERMRIDASGNLLVGTQTLTSGSRVVIRPATNQAGLTVQQNGAGDYCLHLSAVSNAGTFYYQTFFAGATQVGFIYSNTTTTTYATSSDYRLKENVQPMTGALDTIAQLNPVTYNWKLDGSDGQGFIAHELQAVVPDCVTGKKDDVDDEGKPRYQGVDTSFLVATLVKAIQELTARIAVLEAK